MDNEEAHSIDFEYESKFRPQDMMKMMAKLPMLRFSSDTDSLKNFLFSSNGKWRIGNIDGFLKSRWE